MPDPFSPDPFSPAASTSGASGRENSTRYCGRGWLKPALTHPSVLQELSPDGRDLEGGPVLRAHSDPGPSGGFSLPSGTLDSWGTFLFVPGDGGGRTQRLALCSRGFKDPSRSGRGHHRNGGKRVRPDVVPLLAKSGLRVSHAVERRERLGSNWSVNVHHDLASRGVLGSSCTTPPLPPPPTVGSLKRLQ